MAEEAELTIKVGIEASVSNALLEFAQKIFDETGLLIKNADFEWIDFSTLSKRGLIASAVRVQTSKNTEV